MLSSAGWLLRVVALTLCGEPTGEADGLKLKFGDVEIDLETGKFYDYDAEHGGYAIDLVRHVRKLENGAAEAWIAEQYLTNELFEPPPLPEQYQAERSILGLALLDREIFASIEEEIVATDFAVDLHAALFDYLAELYRGGGTFDAAAATLAIGGDHEPFAGYSLKAYLARIAAAAPFGIDARVLARSIAEEAALARGEPDAIQDLEEKKPFVSQFDGLPFERLDEPGPEHEYLIDGWFTVGDKSAIAGPSRSGKSFFAIEAAGCIATGQAFFGYKVMVPGLVIYQAGEGRRGIKKRFRAWRQYNGITPGTRIPIYILQARIDIYSADGDTGKLIAECKGIAAMYDMPLRALFIDTLAKAQGSADENSGKDMSVVMGNVDKISEALPGVHVGLVHHFNAAGTKIRGHSSVYAGLDQVIVVTKDENSKVKTAVLDKQKDDVDDQQIRFELMQIEIGKRAVDGRPITSCVTIPVGGVPIEAPGAKKPYTIKLTNERAVILAALRDALAEHGEAPPPAMKLPRAISRVTRVKYWKDEYLKKAPDGGNADNTINKRMSMASAQFQHLRIIGRNNPFVWLTGRGVAGVITTVPDMPAETAPDGAVDGTDDVPIV